MQKGTHAVMDDKSAKIGGCGYDVGGRQALRRFSLGPNQLWHAPPRGKVLGTPGDTWELGPRRYPFILIRCPSPTHCVLHHTVKQAD